jgi:hypothetical protein
MKNAFEIRGDMTVILLNTLKHGRLETLIDTGDLPKAQEYNGTWTPCWSKYVNGFYVRGHSRDSEGKCCSISFHRFLTSAPDGLFVDHINGNTLDNRRSVNLRLCTNAENQQNRKGAPRHHQHGIRGVTWHKRFGKWQARIQVDGKRIYLGRFDDVNEAEKAAVEARKEYMPFSREEKDGVWS